MVLGAADAHQLEQTMPFIRATPFAVALLLCVVGIAHAQTTSSLVLPAQGDTCKHLQADRESAVWRCPGPSGYSLIYADSVMQAALSFGMSGKEKQLDSPELMWPPAGDGIGTRVEWQMTNDKPVAAIIGRWRRTDDAVPPTVVEELLVVKVTQAGGCTLGIVGALALNSMAFARNLAKARASTFRCGIDKPTFRTNLAQDNVTNLDHRFSSKEILSHNGSIMELSRSRAGMIEIRYKDPRRALTVEAGTLLFRGQEHNGELKGEAFVFKLGCTPAAYEVSGHRKEGVLFLEGVAPHRGRECSIISGSKTSQHARLVFSHEPVIESPLSAVQQELPFIAQCSMCMRASVRKIEGIGSERAHVEAAVTKDDVQDYCENSTLDTANIDACLKEYSKEIGKIHRADANCSARTVQPSSGGRYRFFKIGEDYGGRAPTWINLASGEVECGERSCNSATATAHFTLLCPRAIPGWTGRHH